MFSRVAVLLFCVASGQAVRGNEDCFPRTLSANVYSGQGRISDGLQSVVEEPTIIRTVAAENELDQEYAWALERDACLAFCFRLPTDAKNICLVIEQVGIEKDDASTIKVVLVESPLDVSGDGRQPQVNRKAIKANGNQESTKRAARTPAKDAPATLPPTYTHNGHILQEFTIAGAKFGQHKRHTSLDFKLRSEPDTGKWRLATVCLRATKGRVGVQSISVSFEIPYKRFPFQIGQRSMSLTLTHPAPDFHIVPGVTVPIAWETEGFLPATLISLSYRNEEGKTLEVPGAYAIPFNSPFGLGERGTFDWHVKKNISGHVDIVVERYESPYSKDAGSSSKPCFLLTLKENQWGVCLSPNGRYLLLYGHSVTLWDAQCRKEVFTKPGLLFDGCQGAWFTGDCSIVILAWYEMYACQYQAVHVASGTVLWTTTKEPIGVMRAVDMRGDELALYDATMPGATPRTRVSRCIKLNMATGVRIAEEKLKAETLTVVEKTYSQENRVEFEFLVDPETGDFAHFVSPFPEDAEFLRRSLRVVTVSGSTRASARVSLWDVKGRRFLCQFPLFEETEKTNGFVDAKICDVSPDERELLLSVAHKNPSRTVDRRALVLLNLESGTVDTVVDIVNATPGAQGDPIEGYFTPDAKYVVHLVDRNVFVVKLERQTNSAQY